MSETEETNAALLKAIALDPNDRHLRLVYADFLEQEAGDETTGRAIREEAPGQVWGRKYGYGYGYGDGDGYGDGYGDGGKKPVFLDGKIVMPTLGKNQLHFIGGGFAFVGRAVAQHGLYTWEFERASMLCRTGGVPWDEVADDPARRAEATFRPWNDGGKKTLTITSSLWVSYDWTGELP